GGLARCTRRWLVTEGFGAPAEADVGGARRLASVSTLRCARPAGEARSDSRPQQPLAHRRQEQEVDEIGVKLGSTSGGDHTLGLHDAGALSIMPIVRDGVEGIGERHDARSKWNLSPA